MKKTLKVFVFVLLGVLFLGCSNPKGKLEEMGIPYSQDNFFDKGVYKQNKEVIRLFLEAGLDVEASDKDGDTVLHNAAYKGNFEILQMVIEKYNGNVNSLNKKGLDVLGAYLSKNIRNYEQLEHVVKFLIEKGATLERFSSIKSNSFTQLTHLGDVNQGIKNENQLKIIKLMLDNGYNVNAPTQHRSGQNYLTAAAYDMDMALLELLLEYDVDVNYQEKSNKDTAIHIIYQRYANHLGGCWGCDEKYWQEKRKKLNDEVTVVKKIMTKMIDKGAKFTQLNGDKETPLGSMNMGPSILRDAWIKELVAFGFSQGEDVNVANRSGENLLYRILAKHQDKYMDNIKESVQFMLKKGVSPLTNTNFTFRDSHFNALDAFCLDMDRLSWNSKNTYPNICPTRNVIEFKKFFEVN